MTQEIAKVMGLKPHEKIAGFIYLGASTVPLEDRPRPDPMSLLTSWTGAMTIRGVLFDKDGTLIEVNDTWILSIAICSRTCSGPIRKVRTGCLNKRTRSRDGEVQGGFHSRRRHHEAAR